MIRRRKKDKRATHVPKGLTVPAPLVEMRRVTVKGYKHDTIWKLGL
jgi:hypothetical protein